MAYELKTRPTPADVDAFLAAAEPVARRDDGRALCDLMADVTGEAPRMWGPSIVGFGSYHYRYASGHEGEMCRMGFSPRKASLVLYLSSCPERPALLARLGKHTTSKACLYVKRLADVDEGVLEALVRASWASKQAGCGDDGG